ncbi:hypothetical protein F5I97DRAFT_1038359 [Phlebopus sp. FC_14]|nr:hypothetical protein F5I97DRAFT_1038359 [Phlebopus sp. FC_14]
MMHAETIVPSENWDDDFEFSQNSERRVARKIQESVQPRLSVASSHFSEDWDAEGPSSTTSKPTITNILEDKKNHLGVGLRNQLANWAEPGPSTPTKRFTVQAENWDDDFEDKTESPAQRHHHHKLRTRHSYHTPPRPRPLAEPENWDDDFDTEKNDTPMAKRTRHDAYVGSSDEEGEFGFMDKEEDRTVTARSRSGLMLRQSPPPPVPALPQSFLSPIEPFPRSPTTSVFSIPTTSGRNSVAQTSTSHLALLGGSLAMLPPSPPIHRERRRLRKKSRPPHLDNNVFELVEEQRDSTPPLPPSTPERPSSPPLPPSEATPSNTKTPLLSRIGSVKKWGVRRKRASTGPAEVTMREIGNGEDRNPRPSSSLAQSPPTISHDNSKSGWFFRPGGVLGSGSPPPPQTAELKYEPSLDKAKVRSGTNAALSTPSKSKLSRGKPSRTFDPSSSGELFVDGEGVGEGKPSLLVGRRPTSMQVPNGRYPSSGTRHASYGSSVGRTTSSRVFSTPTPTESVDELNVLPQPQEGSRSFMGSVRKISLVGQKKHKKKKSTAEIIPLPPVPTSPVAHDELQDSQMADLLPPIELQPPSPPRTINRASASRSPPTYLRDGTEPLAAALGSVSASLPSSTSPVAASRASPKTPSSPQSASLGRATQAPNPVPYNSSVPRRNSLGDLKIPARISQAQIGLKRDLTMVREFAASIDKLKELQSTYHSLIGDIHAMLEDTLPSRATSPTIFNLGRPRSRLRSNTKPTSPLPGQKQLASSLRAITSKYKISWECAELLIELGGGAPSPASPPSTSVSAPSMRSELDNRKSRERAVTLSGEESKPPPPFGATSASGPPTPAWRASTGRHDLSQRQLVLLRDILHNGEALPDGTPVPDDAMVINRNWRWGDAMSSTVTLPSEESNQGSEHVKKRRASKIGMSGLRDMLRMLKRSHSQQPPPPPVPASTASLSTESSMDSDSHHHHHSHAQLRRKSKASTGPESVRLTREQSNSPYGGPPLNHKASPRRPSLASIFRLGQKNKGSFSAGESSQDSHSDVRSASRGSNMTGEEEDWDRIDFAVDLDAHTRAVGSDGHATIKGKRGRSSYLPEHGHCSRPVTPRRAPDTSQISFQVEASPRSIRPMRSTRLSNVEEVEDGERQPRSAKSKNRSSLPRVSPHRPPSRGQMIVKTGSVRSAPPQSVDADTRLLPDFKLSMTPENIKPLLENAKEVHLRLNECIKEVRMLMDMNTST